MFDFEYLDSVLDDNEEENENEVESIFDDIIQERKEEMRKNKDLRLAEYNELLDEDIEDYLL